MGLSEGSDRDRRVSLVDTAALGELGEGQIKGGILHDAIRRATEWAQVNAVLHIVLLQLGQDVFSISVLPQGGNVGPDLHRDTSDMFKMDESSMRFQHTLYWHFPFRSNINIYLFGNRNQAHLSFCVHVYRTTDDSDMINIIHVQVNEGLG